MQASYFQLLYFRLIVFKEFLHIQTIIHDIYPLMMLLPEINHSILSYLSVFELFRQLSPELHLNVFEPKVKVDVVIDHHASDFDLSF